MYCFLSVAVEVFSRVHHICFPEEYGSFIVVLIAKVSSLFIHYRCITLRVLSFRLVSLSGKQC